VPTTGRNYETVFRLGRQLEMLCLWLGCVYPHSDGPANPLLHKSTGVLRLQKGCHPCDLCSAGCGLVLRVEFIGVNCRLLWPWAHSRCLNKKFIWLPSFQITTDNWVEGNQQLSACPEHDENLDGQIRNCSRCRLPEIRRINKYFLVIFYFNRYFKFYTLFRCIFIDNFKNTFQSRY